MFEQAHEVSLRAHDRLRTMYYLVIARTSLWRMKVAKIEVVQHFKFEVCTFDRVQCLRSNQMLAHDVQNGCCHLLHMHAPRQGILCVTYGYSIYSVLTQLWMHFTTLYAYRTKPITDADALSLRARL